MPRTPEKFADVLSHIVKNATPQKKKLLEEMGLHGITKLRRGLYNTMSDSIIKQMAKIKSRRAKSVVRLKRSLALVLKSTKKARNFKLMANQTGLSY